VTVVALIEGDTVGRKVGFASCLSIVGVVAAVTALSSLLEEAVYSLDVKRLLRNVDPDDAWDGGDGDDDDADPRWNAAEICSI
jgi:hypothetical protein